MNGFWAGREMTTMSHQAVMLGIPAVQLEMPPAVRERLVVDPSFTDAFAAGLAYCYHNVVVPWWSTRAKESIPWPASLAFNEDLARNVVEVQIQPEHVGFDDWTGQLLHEL